MPETYFGLPLHPLVVHAAVVVIPTAVVVVILAAVWPRFRRWAGILPPALSVVGLILDPLSTSTGDPLESHLPHSALIEKHSQLADGLLPFMIALTVLSVGLYVLHRRADAGKPLGGRLLLSGVAVLAVLVSVGTGVQVARIGHSGAEAAWHGTMQGTASR